MVGVPAESPVTTPVALIEPWVVLLLDHVPPAGVLLSVVVRPTHTVAGPVIAVGNALTVATTEEAQPVGNV